MSYLKDIEERGYAVIPALIDDQILKELIVELAQVLSKDRAKNRAGLRNLLTISPRCRKLANSNVLKEIVEPVLGESSRVVRGIYFDKHREANWKVAWHQDLTIAVKEKVEIEGYGPWSLKAGVTHVQPPLSVLARMLTVRLHLDDTDETNGALRVIPGSHRLGRLSSDAISECIQANANEICNVQKGGTMLMKPLLLHSSSTSKLLRHRRIIHLEYCAAELSEGLEWNENK